MHIVGRVSGPGSAGISVTLEQTPYPFTGPFKAVGTAAKTDVAGNYAFVTTPPGATRYRVVAKTRPQATSPVARAQVRLLVGLRATTTHPKRGQFVGFSGTVEPGQGGAFASLQRLTSTGFKTIARSALVPTTPLNGVQRSAYAFRVRVPRSGRYRVRAASGTPAYLPGVSRVRTLTAHA
jgi:hypothetical protein